MEVLLVEGGVFLGRPFIEGVELVLEEGEGYLHDFPIIGDVQFLAVLFTRAWERQLVAHGGLAVDAVSLCGKCSVWGQQVFLVPAEVRHFKFLEHVYLLL